MTGPAGGGVCSISPCPVSGATFEAALPQTKVSLNPCSVILRKQPSILLLLTRCINSVSLLASLVSPPWLRFSTVMFTPKHQDSRRLKDLLYEFRRGKCNFPNFSCPKSQLQTAFLPFINLTASDFRQSDFRHAVLAASEFGEANLEGASFEHANLLGANLKAANLQQANLNHSLLASASLQGACLRGANHFLQ